jgi:hypothetical protein
MSFRVRRATIPQEQAPLPKTYSVQLHFSFLAKQGSPIVDESVIYKMFSCFGEILEISFKKMSFNPVSGIQDGYGFVHFPFTREGVASAFVASDTLKQFQTDNLLFSCSLSRGLKHLLSDPKRLARLGYAPSSVPLPVQMGATAMDSPVASSRTIGARDHLPTTSHQAPVHSWISLVNHDMFESNNSESPTSSNLPRPLVHHHSVEERDFFSFF